MDWRDENRLIRLELKLDEAVDLLVEFGLWDPINEVENQAVRDFLDSAKLRELQD